MGGCLSRVDVPEGREEVTSSFSPWDESGAKDRICLSQEGRCLPATDKRIVGPVEVIVLGDYQRVDGLWSWSSLETP